MGSRSTVTGMLAVVYIFISSVFFLLILNPVPADVVSSIVVLSCIWLWLYDRSARSSVKSRSSSCVQIVHCILLFLPVAVSFMIQSWPGGRGRVKAGTPAELQSSPLKFETARQSGQFCSSCPDRCTGWGRLSSRRLHSVSVASTLSLCLHCRVFVSVCVSMCAI